VGHDTRRHDHGTVRAGAEALICEPLVEPSRGPWVVSQVADANAKLVLRFAISRESVHHCMSFVDQTPTVRISIRYPDAFGDSIADVRRVLDEPDAGPTSYVLRRVAPLVVAPMRGYVIAAIALGASRTTSTQYAAACGSALRTLQWRFRSREALAPQRLLKWGRVFWMSWRMRHQGLGAKQTALLGGFRSTSAMAACVRPIERKATLAAFVDSLPIDVLAERFAAELCRSFGFRENESVPFDGDVVAKA
jgi:hypothetical protein